MCLGLFLSHPSYYSWFFMFPYFQNFFKNTSIRGGVTCSSLGRRKDVLKILVIVYFFGYLLLFLFSTNFVYIDKCFVLYTYKDVCREVSWAFFISPFILFLDFLFSHNSRTFSRTHLLEEA